MNGTPTGPGDFERRLSVQLKAVTDGLAPSIEFDDVVSAPVPHWTRGRVMGRAAAIGLVAAAAASMLLWTARSPRDVAVESVTSPPSTPTGSEPVVAASSAPLPTTGDSFPAADPNVKNFLIVGADNNACIAPDSPYAGAFGDRESMGERGDTIIILRLDPSAGRAAMLSFPRDLWVAIDGGNRKSRINSAYRRDDPQKLINTIYNNFGIGVDHYIQVDFCAFKTIVDAVGGVSVPFDYPARDRETGLDVPSAGCFTFDGDHALAYVRSRHLQYLDSTGVWQEDPGADLSRISRQQDFVRRVLRAALDRGITDVGLARTLLDAVSDQIVVDTGLTISKMLEYLGVIVELDAAGMAGYQIEAEGAVVAGASVLVPTLDTPSMIAVLRVFRGDSPLASSTSDVTSTDPAAPSAATPTALVVGFVPPADVTCDG